MSAKNQDIQDMRQEQNKDIKSRSYCELGQSGRLAHVYRRFFYSNANATPTQNTHAHARIGLFLYPDCPNCHMFIGFYLLTHVLTDVLNVLTGEKA